MGVFKKFVIFNSFFLMAVGLLFHNAYAKERGYLDPNQTITVKSSSPQVSIRLPANPSTGYQWVLVKYDSTFMYLPSGSYVPSKSEAAGAPGYALWKFKFKKSAFYATQKTEVILEYKRPWEHNVPGKRQIIRFETKHS
jgi:inhibitor of cysteine peptidase